LMDYFHQMVHWLLVSRKPYLDLDLELSGVNFFGIAFFTNKYSQWQYTESVLKQ
jgi:hypothetical protein